MMAILRTSLILTLLSGAMLGGSSAQADEFPQSNAWYQATPSVVWCGDETSTTTLEVHIVGRSDVARVWLTNLGTQEEEGRAELFDDGTHGDLVAGDLIFTLADVVIPCQVGNEFEFGWKTAWQFLRVELDDGRQMGNNYGLVVGLVDPQYKGAFEVTELAPGITATSYALFIEDSQHEVIDNYPVSSVYCGTSNNVAFRKLYSVLPDVFDIAMVQPGMIIFRPDDLAENVPYNVLVSNQVEHIGVDVFDNSAQFGSQGRLKSVIYMSFAAISVFDHEIAHTWGAAIGQPLGLLGDQYNASTNQGHWNKLADVEGQLGAYYFDDNGSIGHFSYAGDDIWTLISNRTAEPYSPLELYTMGLLPASEVPPIHILSMPDTSNLDAITAASYRTVTMEDIVAAEGGERNPPAGEAQTAFNLAFIVTQDRPYDDAAYAFFSLMSYQLTNQDPPSTYRPSLAPFYWATGGRATLDTRLPLELTIPRMPGMPEEETSPTEEQAMGETQVSEGELTEETEGQGESDGTVPPADDDGSSQICFLLPAGIVLILPTWVARRKRH
jgi:hypothetical protein